jgi:hypothetical protein
MDAPKNPHDRPAQQDHQTTVQKWLELKQEMEVLHAQVQYVRLMLKMGVLKQKA